MISSTAESSARSAVIGNTRSSSPACMASRSERRATATTEAPAVCRTRTNRSPSPLDAPVTIATWPLKSNSSPGVCSGVIRTSVLGGVSTLNAVGDWIVTRSDRTHLLHILEPRTAQCRLVTSLVGLHHNLGAYG